MKNIALAVLLAFGGAQTAFGAAFEAKALIHPKDIAKALKTLPAQKTAPRLRDIFYIDTPALELLKNGLVLRARLDRLKKSDFTVKLTGLTALPPAGIGPMECQTDQTPASQSLACSANEKRDFAALDAQLRKSPALAPSPRQIKIIDYKKLRGMMPNARVYGPVNSARFDFDYKGRAVTLEHWQAPGMTQILEISVKGDAPDGMPFIMALLKENGLAMAEIQGGKTGYVLRHFAAAK